jgi:hypothetical protein
MDSLSYHSQAKYLSSFSMWVELSFLEVISILFLSSPPHLEPPWMFLHLLHQQPLLTTRPGKDDGLKIRLQCDASASKIHNPGIISMRI